MDGMLAGIPAALLAEWTAFDKVEPISLGYRGDVQAGIVASLLANVYRDPSKKAEPYTPEDFIPSFRRAERRNPRDMWKEIRSWAILNGAKVN